MLRTEQETFGGSFGGNILKEIVLTIKLIIFLDFLKIGYQ